MNRSFIASLVASFARLSNDELSTLRNCLDVSPLMPRCAQFSDCLTEARFVSGFLPVLDTLSAPRNPPAEPVEEPDAEAA